MLKTSLKEKPLFLAHPAYCGWEFSTVPTTGLMTHSCLQCVHCIRRNFTTWPLDPNNEAITNAVLATPVDSIPAAELSQELMKRRDQLVDPGA